MKLREPTWLTLSETLSLLADNDIPLALAKERLIRAFRHGDIKTQGRSLSIFRNDESTVLPDFAWFAEAVDWDASVISIRSEFDGDEYVDNVEVCRTELFNWLGLADHSGPEYRSPFMSLMLAAEANFGMRLLPTADRAGKKEVEDWLKEHWEEFVESSPSGNRLKAMAGLIRHPELAKGGAHRSK